MSHVLARMLLASCCAVVGAGCGIVSDGSTGSPAGPDAQPGDPPPVEPPDAAVAPPDAAVPDDVVVPPSDTCFGANTLCDELEPDPYVAGPTVSCVETAAQGVVRWTRSMESFDCGAGTCQAWAPRLDVASDDALLLSSQMFFVGGIFPAGLWLARFGANGDLQSSSTPIVHGMPAVASAEYLPFGPLADGSLLVRERLGGAAGLRRFETSGNELPAPASASGLERAAPTPSGGLGAVLVRDGAPVDVEIATEPGGETESHTVTRPQLDVARFDAAGRLRWRQTALSPLWGMLAINYDQVRAFGVDARGFSSLVVAFENGSRVDGPAGPNQSLSAVFEQRLARLDLDGNIDSFIQLAPNTSAPGPAFGLLPSGALYAVWTPVVEEATGYFSQGAPVLERFDDQGRSQWILPLDRFPSFPPSAQLSVDPEGNAVVTRLSQGAQADLVTIVTVSADGLRCERLEVTIASACRPNGQHCDLRALAPRGAGSFYFATEAEAGLIDRE